MCTYVKHGCSYIYVFACTYKNVHIHSCLHACILQMHMCPPTYAYMCIHVAYKHIYVDTHISAPCPLTPLSCRCEFLSSWPISIKTFRSHTCNFLPFTHTCRGESPVAMGDTDGVHTASFQNDLLVLPLLKLVHVHVTCTRTGLTTDPPS